MLTYHETLKEKIDNLKKEHKIEKIFFKNIVEELNSLQNFANKHKKCKNDIEKITFAAKLLEKVFDTEVYYEDEYSSPLSNYYFKLPQQLVADLLLNKNFVKKTIKTNIILQKEDCTWHDENPYFCKYEDFYYPASLQIYCPKDFDDKKVYTLKEINKLVKTNKILHFKNIVTDKKSSELPNKDNNYTICGINFGKNFIEKKYDEVVYYDEDDSSIFVDSLDWIPQIRRNDYNFVRNKIIDSMSTYPNLPQALTNAVLQTIQQDKKLYTDKIKNFNAGFIKEYCQILEKEQEIINDQQQKLNAEKDKLKKLEQNSIKVEELMM